MKCRVFGGSVRRGAITSLLIATLLAVSLSLAAPAKNATASGYSINAQGDCSPGYPRGDAWLNWWDMGGNPLGSTWGTMFYNTGAGWMWATNGYGSDTGSTGNAVTHLSKSYLAASWRINDSHTADFFTGTQYSQSYVWNC